MGNFISQIWSYFNKPPNQLPSGTKEDNAAPEESKYKKLAASLRGKTIHVPNVELMYGDWPMNQINTCYAKLHEVTEAKIASLGFQGNKLQRFRGADLALFVCAWWPHAPFEVCITLVYWVIWIFVWDDEIDLEENVVGNNFSAAQVFRQDTFKFIEYTLGFGNYPGQAPPASNVIISNFSELGERLRAQFNERQRKSFLEEIRFYIDMTQLEQEMKFSDFLPSLDEFWAMRMGSSAVKPCIVMAELTIGAELPQYIREHPDFKVLWDETTISISLSNDIFSLKKELRSDDGVLSVIPLSINQGMELQPAVDAAMDFLKASINRFNDAAIRLSHLSPPGTADHKAVADYIDVLKTNQSGHHYWGTRTGRYFLMGQVKDDGSMEIVL